jgi:hypothetical protein
VSGAGAPALLAFALLLVSGCATRGTIAELGRPEFSGTIPADLQLTLIEPKMPGQFHAYPSGSGQGDYHCQTRMLEAPHPIGDQVTFVMNATPTGDQKLKLFSVIAWPLLSRDEIHFKDDGHPPGHPEPLKQVTVDHPALESEEFGVVVTFPAARLKGFDHIGVSALVQYEDGWITIVDSAVLAPAP